MLTLNPIILNPIAAVERRLFAPVPARRHQLVVMALAAAAGARLATHHYSHMADLPPALFAPPWFLGWLSGPPSAATLVAVQVLGVLAAVATLVGRGRWVLPFGVTWLTLMFLGGIETSAGKILHNDVLLLLAMAPFLVPPSRLEDTSDGDPDEAVLGWHHRTAMVLVAIGYAAAAVMKFRHSGVAWVTSDNLRWVLYTGANRESTPFPGVARALADRAWMATSIAVATLATELVFPLAVLVRRLRVPLALAVVGLHVGVYLTLGLDYWTWVATVLVLFTPWTRPWLPRLARDESHLHGPYRRGTVTRP